MMQELAPLVAAMHPVPPATRLHQLQLWQATLQLVQSGSILPSHPLADPTRDADAEHDETTPYC